jgi:hypothetical protein
MLIVEYFNCLDSMVTNDARWTREIKSGIAMAKAEFSRRRIDSVNLRIGRRFKEEPGEVLHLEHNVL